MFGIGFTELLILSAIVFLLIGPKQLPEVMKMIGKFMKQISKAQDEFRSSIDKDDQLRNIREEVEGVKRNVQNQVDRVKSDIYKLDDEDSQKKS